MKKSMTYKIGTLVIGLTAMLFTSCLSDGDDTMVLEKRVRRWRPNRGCWYQ